MDMISMNGYQRDKQNQVLLMFIEIQKRFQFQKRNKEKCIINTNNTDKNKVKIGEYLIYIEFEKIKKIKFHKKHKNKKRVRVKEYSNFNTFTLFLF